MTKEEIFQKIEQHYRNNFENLKKRYYRSSGGFHNSEDVVQEGYTRALELWATFDPTLLEFDEWMNRLMNNSMRNWRRNNRVLSRSIELTEEDHILNAELTFPYDTMVLAEISEDIRNHPDKKASEVLALYFLKQTPLKDIVDTVDYSYGAVRNIIYRYRTELKEKYA